MAFGLGDTRRVVRALAVPGDEQVRRVDVGTRAEQRERGATLVAIDVERRVARERVLVAADAGLVDRSTTAPCAASASASSLPLPFLAGISGEFQSRSVGPLPAMKMMPGY